MKCISDKKLVTNLGLGIYTLPFESFHVVGSRKGYNNKKPGTSLAFLFSCSM
jgi:hypothetical protein